MIREELGEENPVSGADEMKEQLKKISQRGSKGARSAGDQAISEYAGWQWDAGCDPDISGNGANCRGTKMTKG
ncbi:MAG: hypothetical protein ACLR8P_11610 [Clostridium fessum]